jgi:hypothetical protein
MSRRGRRRPTRDGRRPRERQRDGGRPRAADTGARRPAEPDAGRPRRTQPGGGGPRGPSGGRAGSSFGAQVLLLAAVFAVAVLAAELAGAANLGVALGVGQIAFAITLVYLLLRR